MLKFKLCAISFTDNQINGGLINFALTLMDLSLCSFEGHL